MNLLKIEDFLVYHTHIHNLVLADILEKMNEVEGHLLHSSTRNIIVSNTWFLVTD